MKNVSIIGPEDDYIEVDLIPYEEEENEDCVYIKPKLTPEMRERMKTAKPFKADPSKLLPLDLGDSQ